MSVSRHIAPALGLVVLAFALPCGTSLASPTTVQLRVEGSSKTIFEGSVTTDAETFETASSKGPHPCDYKDNGTEGTQATGTPTTALRDAALANGLAFDASWFGAGPEKNGNPGDFFVSQIGSDVNESSPPFNSWGYAVNYKTAEVGGCEIALVAGEEVLWAYNFFNLSHLLSLSGPASANAGTAVTVHVNDGQSGEAIAGASIGELIGGAPTGAPAIATTDANGNATITLTHQGTVTLKATRPDSVRSNALRVCVHNGNDGTCGTQAPVGQTPSVVSNTSGVAGFVTHYTGPYALVANATGLIDGHVYGHGRAPRILSGSILSHTAVSSVSLELRREYRGRCFAYDGAAERFRHAHCGQASFFKVSAGGTFSYLLPEALRRGRYVLDVLATDIAGNRTTLARGTSRLVFYVR